jgi:glycosyltransferase involved in cell wall biosynthesis
VYDDGSTDKTGAVLRDLTVHIPRLVVISQTNRGHGPTILRGYREARGEWVFQTDSDGEIPAAPFRELWARRTAYDLLLGYRSRRRLAPARRIVTYGSRLAVWALFGSAVRDVNSPFRLVRREWLHATLPRMPADAFAPNVILAGLAARGRLRIHEQPVPYRARPTGKGSLVASRLWRGACRSLIETVAVAVGRDGGRSR